MSYKWYREMMEQLELEELREQAERSGILTDNSTGENVEQLKLLPSSTIPASTPIILFTDKLMKSDYKHHLESYKKAHGGREPSEHEVWNYASLRIESEFALLLPKLQMALGDCFVMIALHEGAKGRTIAVKEVESLDEIFATASVTAQTLYVKDNDLCMEVIHDKGVSTMLIREWKYSITGAEKSLLMDKILANEGGAWTALTTATWQVGRQFLRTIKYVDS